MNINYIIGIVGAFGVFLLGCVLGINIGPDAAAAGLKLFTFTPKNLWNFFDAASIFITIGCTIFVVLASFSGGMLKAIPKHFKIILNNKAYDPKGYIDQLVELAQIARKNGLLSLEEKANEQADPFFKQAIMLIVDANDQDKVRGILENDIDCMSARHERRSQQPGHQHGHRPDHHAVRLPAGPRDLRARGPAPPGPGQRGVPLQADHRGGRHGHPGRREPQVPPGAAPDLHVPEAEGAWR